jgi:methylglutaconyl-CoA hydratase
VGHKIARDLLVSGRIFDANEAHRLGLVNEVVDATHLISRSRQLAASLQENSPASMRATKALINNFIGKDLDRQFAESIAQNAQSRTTADFREGVTSFLEKRKPKWTGN